MRNWKLFGKIGAIALTALGLSLLPGNFNVPGVGSVQAFASEAVETGDLTGATVTIAGGATATYDKGVKNITIGSIAGVDEDQNKTVKNANTIFELVNADTGDIKNAGTYSLKLKVKSGQNTENKFTGFEDIR